MEVLLYEEKLFDLDHLVPGYNFEYPCGSTIIVDARKTFLPQIPVTQELLDGLHSAGVTPRVQVGQSIPGLKVCVGFEDEMPDEGNFELIDGPFLRSLFGGNSRCREDAKVLLKVTQVVGPVSPSTIRPSAGVNRMVPQEITPEDKWLMFNAGRREVKDLNVHCNFQGSINNWIDGNWTILLSVKLVLHRCIGADPSVQDLLAPYRTMLTDNVLADTKVVAQNGAEIMFHRSILAAHSPAFERMFQTKMKEAASGVLELSDMTEESVRALKEYLYVWELKAAQENSLVCFELFEAGHKYGISTLEEATSKILLRLGSTWYSAVVALRLLLLVKNMDMPRFFVLRTKRAELKTLDEYRDMFRTENAAVAMELTECFMSGDYF